MDHGCDAEANAHKDEIEAVCKIVPSCEEQDGETHDRKHGHQGANISAKHDQSGMEGDDGCAEIDCGIVDLQLAEDVIDRNGSHDSHVFRHNAHYIESKRLRKAKQSRQIVYGGCPDIVERLECLRQSEIGLHIRKGLKILTGKALSGCEYHITKSENNGDQQHDVDCLAFTV